MIVPSCRIAIRSASCSASSRYCVVSSTVVPPLGEFLDGLPDLEPRLRVEAGRRLVEEDDRRVADQAHGDVEPAAHAARVRVAPAGWPRRSSPNRASRSSATWPGFVTAPQFGDEHEVLPAGENARPPRRTGPVRLIVSRTSLPAGSPTSKPQTLARAAVRLEQGREDVHHRGLAGAVRSEQREDAARARTSKSTPFRTLVSLKDFVRPFVSMATSVIALPPPRGASSCTSRLSASCQFSV